MTELSETPVRVLLVEDDEDDYVLTRDLLREVDSRGFILDWVADYGAARAAISRREHDVYLLDYRLGERDGIELLSEVRAREIDAPIILLTGLGNRELDFQAMRAGAVSYLAKGELDATLLDRTIRYAIQMKAVEEQLRARTRQQEAIVELGHHALVDPDLGTLLDRGLETARETLSLEHAVLFEIDPGEMKLVPRASQGIAGAVQEESLTARPLSLAGFTLVEGDPVVTADVTGDRRFRSLIGSDLGLASAASVIVRGREAPLGTFAVYARERRTFTADEVTFLQAAAAVLGGAIERRRTDEALQRAEEAERHAARVATAIALAAGELLLGLTKPALLERLCRLCGELLSCDVAAVLAKRTDGSTWTTIASWGANLEDELVASALELPGEAWSGLLGGFGERDLVEIADDRRDPADDLRPRNSLYLALRREGYVSAVLLVSRSAEQGRFSSVQRQIADGIAKLASLALEYARVLDELDQANRIKSDFVATISHELRTPLHVVIGYTELLLDDQMDELTPSQREALLRIDRQARTLAELVSQTLDLSRLDRQGLPVDLRDVSVEVLLRDLVEETHELRDKPGVAVEWRLAPDLPLLTTDPTKLKVALRNVLGNAVKFTDRGTVTVEARATGDGVQIAVVDTGMGIAPERLETIFEPFRQLESSFTRKHGGAGLGLYVSRRFVHLLGGRIEVESEPGAGSTFRIWLPTRPAA
jgi:signal transduction histidine kinase/DNA-binding response OmpR family regulator